MKTKNDGGETSPQKSEEDVYKGMMPFLSWYTGLSEDFLMRLWRSYQAALEVHDRKVAEVMEGMGQSIRKWESMPVVGFMRVLKYHKLSMSSRYPDSERDWWADQIDAIMSDHTRTSLLAKKLEFLADQEAAHNFMQETFEAMYPGELLRRSIPVFDVESLKNGFTPNILPRK